MHTTSRSSRDSVGQVRLLAKKHVPGIHLRSFQRNKSHRPDTRPSTFAGPDSSRTQFRRPHSRGM